MTARWARSARERKSCRVHTKPPPAAARWGRKTRNASYHIGEAAAASTRTAIRAFHFSARVIRSLPPPSPRARRRVTSLRSAFKPCSLAARKAAGRLSGARQAEGIGRLPTWPRATTRSAVNQRQGSPCIIELYADHRKLFFTLAASPFFIPPAPPPFFPRDKSFLFYPWHCCRQLRAFTIRVSIIITLFSLCSYVGSPHAAAMILSSILLQLG